jgi:DNA-binding MurR/RpiR family transcriptional regulator
MTKDERNIIRKAVKSQPEKTYGQIAADLGISKPTLIRAIKGTVCRQRGRKLNLRKAS